MGIFSSIAQNTKFIARGVKLSMSGATGTHKKLMSSVTDPQLRSIFDHTVFSYRSLSLEENKMAMSWMEDIAQKLEMCSDETIRKTAEKWIKETKFDTFGNIEDSFCKVEHLLDSINCAEQKYLPLYNPKLPFTSVRYKSWLKKQLEALENVANSSTKEEVNKIADDTFYVYSAPRVSFLSHKLQGNIFSYKSFDIYSRYSLMEDFMIRYPEEAELCKRLYNKHYLPIIKQGRTSKSMGDDTPKIIELLKSIEKEFGTKTFLDYKDSLTDSSLEAIMDELSIWKTISSGKAKQPRTLNISEHSYSGFIRRKASGYCNMLNERIGLEGPHVFSASKTLRHEMGHLNDKKPGDRNVRVEIPENRKLEMRQAGLSQSDIKYAETNDLEYKACFLEGTTSSYSQEFKDEMVERGLPRFAVDIPEHRTFFENILLEKLSNKESIEAYNLVKNYYEGEVPLIRIKELIESPELLPFAKKVLANNNHQSLDLDDLLFSWKWKLDEYGILPNV